METEKKLPETEEPREAVSRLESVQPINIIRLGDPIVPNPDFMQFVTGAVLIQREVAATPDKPFHYELAYLSVADLIRYWAHAAELEGPRGGFA